MSEVPLFPKPGTLHQEGLPAVAVSPFPFWKTRDALPEPESL